MGRSPCDGAMCCKEWAEDKAVLKLADKLKEEAGLRHVTMCLREALCSLSRGSTVVT